METSGTINPTQAAAIRQSNETDNALSYNKVKMLVLQHTAQIAHFCRNKYCPGSQLLTVIPHAFSSNCPYIRPFGALPLQNCPACAPVHGYAGST